MITCLQSNRAAGHVRRTIPDVRPIPQSNPTRATVLGALSCLPLIVWWAGWAPAIMSSDSIDQWNQALTFEFVNTHPITHTASLWAISLVWSSPAAVTLVHAGVTTVLLAIVARRLVQIGVRLWISVGAVWFVAVLPMTGAMTVTIWKDVPFSLAMVWVATELLLMARDRDAFWLRLAGPTRLGVALGLMWALRPNGMLTVIAFAGALVVGFRRRWRGVAVTILGIVGVGLVLPAVLVTVLPVTDAGIEPAQVFMPDVASVVVNDRGDLSPQDLDLVTAVAPIPVYEDAYQCGNSTPLLFHPAYHNEVIREHPSEYRALIVRTYIKSFPTVLGHRWCAAEYLLSPFNRTHTFVHRPPYDIWPNTLGLARTPISDRAYAFTLKLYQLVEQSEIEWLTWRPALVVLAGLVTFAFVAWRRRLRPLLWIGGFYVIHLANVALTSPAHEFRYAYGLWLIALTTLPLWYLIVDPGRARLAPVTITSARVGSAAPSSEHPAGDAHGDPETGDDDDVRVPDDVSAGNPVDDEEHHR